VGNIQQRFEIERPLEAVYEALAQPQLVLESLPAVTRVTREGDDRYRIVAGQPNAPAEIELRLTARVPLRRIEWRTGDGMWSGSLDLEPLGPERTAVNVAAEPSGGAEGAPPAPSAVHDALQALKRAVQSPRIRVSAAGEYGRGSGASGWAGSGTARRYASEWRETAQSAFMHPTEFPLKFVRTLTRQMDRMWSEVVSGSPITRLPQLVPGLQWNPSVEVWEQDDQIRVCIDVPGVGESNLQVEIDGGALTVRGERQDEHATEPGRRRSEFHYGSFTRRIPLPDGMDTEGARAVLRNGVLEIRIPMHRREPRRVPVQHAG
jgi:HSP20 family protein